jgi:hypothetical protein
MQAIFSLWQIGSSCNPQRFGGSSSVKAYEVASNEIGISLKIGVSQSVFVFLSGILDWFIAYLPFAVSSGYTSEDDRLCEMSSSSGSRGQMVVRESLEDDGRRRIKSTHIYTYCQSLASLSYLRSVHYNLRGFLSLSLLAEQSCFRLLK